MTSIPDSLRDLEAAYTKMEQEITEKEARIEALEKELGLLRSERNLYLRLYKEQLQKEYESHPAEVEAQWAAIVEEAERNPGDLAALIQELEARAQGQTSGS